MITNFKLIIFASPAILIALVLAACGATSPTAASRTVRPMTPAPENTTPTLELQQRPQLPTPTLEGNIDVGGHKLNYQCWGEGTPTVIVEAGAGDKPTLTLNWNAVIQGVSPTTRICVYDRVDISTSQDAAENLHILLSKIPLPGPYILVAHSLGGWHARVFAHIYPEDVAGMILVDTTPTYPDSAIAYATAYPTYSPDEPAGITQNRMSDADIFAGVMMPSMDGLDMKASNEQVRQAGSFGDIPLVVIGRIPGPDSFPGLDPVSQEQMGAIMLQVEADLATLSSRGVFIIATTHNHIISLYEPQIIIGAITKMVKEIRNQ